MNANVLTAQMPLDLQISADQMTGAELFDVSSNLIRPQLPLSDPAP
jgi:hypothetical protein